MNKQRRSLPRLAAAGTVVVGLAAGSYGIAGAATGSGTTTTSTATTQPASPATGVTSADQLWGGQRSDENPLTGNAERAVRQAALAKVPNGTIIRVETDADGHAAYEAHMVRADGTPVTVYVDKQFEVVDVESR